MKLIGRKSGILLHITSLPSPFGIGDLGPEAYHFADFMAEAGQHYWQILPLNPTRLENNNSPYSSISAFAGNTLLISPALLATQGFLEKGDLEGAEDLPQERVDFEAVVAFKNKLFDKAHRNFREKCSEEMQQKYDYFCKRNARWLHDYILYSALKMKHGGKDWSSWAPEYREREPQALKKATDELHDFISREYFLQFIFFEQWNALKDYCNEQKIYFIGDMPFYIDYDSADVWTHPYYFKLNKEKKPAVVAGVPPDYFNDQGQLWGMPIYDWDKLKEHRFDWWVERLGQNFKMFKMVRLDHFRAFSSYWQVDAKATNAKGGKYITGPGEALFDTLKEKFDQLNVIAEDLGDIDEGVYELMHCYDLPGMRLLQFGFTDTWGETAYLPHNHIHNSVVYPGTHDNNTIKGWYKHDLSDTARKKVSEYLQQRVNENNVSEHLIRLSYMSVSGLCIIPMQDLLGLGEEGIMNRPSIPKGNWEWRLQPGQLENKKMVRHLRDLSEIYQRNGEKVKSE